MLAEYQISDIRYLISFFLTFISMKPSIPKGTRDFNPQQVMKRNYIINTLRSVFVKYGYQPIETPVMENLSTLTGKYGDEGDQLLFKVLNNGDFLAKADKEAIQNLNSRKLVPSIAKKGLRYDLTVPFARYVVMHQNDIVFPFKRYQIQQVWRGDRPQKGRYQEFYQCDVDVVGSNSLINEVELVQIFDEGYSRLGIDAIIRLNNRKILVGIAEAAGIPDHFMEMTVAIDKLDKIGIEKVKEELAGKGIGQEAILHIEKILGSSTLEELKPLISNSETGAKGMEEMESVFKYLQAVQLNNEVKFDVTLARGLTYYTGTIFEAASKDVAIGSIGGGGRYDDLTGMFGLPNVSGVGVSFGLARLFDIMEELNLFPDTITEGTKVIILTFDPDSFDYGFEVLQKLRAAAIPAELYPGPVKFQKQMKYTNARGIPYAVVIGERERESGLLSFKNMESGDQSSLSVEDIIDQLTDLSV